MARPNAPENGVLVRQPAEEGGDFQVFAGVGLPGRMLPDSVTRTLEALDAARRGRVVASL